MTNKNNQKLNSLFLIWLKCWAFFMAAVEDCSTVSLWIGVEPYPDYLMWIRVWCPVWGLNLQSYFRARVTEAVLGIWVSESSGCWEELSVPQCLGWVLWDCRVVHPQCPELGSALSMVPLWFSHGIQIMTCGCWAVMVCNIKITLFLQKQTCGFSELLPVESLLTNWSWQTRLCGCSSSCLST